MSHRQDRVKGHPRSEFIGMSSAVPANLRNHPFGFVIFKIIPKRTIDSNNERSRIFGIFS